MGRRSCTSSTVALVLLYIVAFTHILLCEGGSNVSCLDSQRKALTTFRKGLNDPSNWLDSWDESLDCCQWGGIACDNNRRYVVYLSLNDLCSNNNCVSVALFPNLSGQLDPVLVELKRLRHLDLSLIAFNGIPIPAFIGSFKELRYLDLSNAGFSGRIPQNLWNLSYLSTLYMSGNSLTGVIPASLGRLSWLQYLSLSSNQLNGTIPTNLGQLSSLILLDVSYNSLTGNVSKSHFEFLKKLEYLDMSSTSLVFNLHPDWVPPFQLKEISLRSCQLGPHFPHWLRNQKHMEALDLFNTTITDTIPTWFWDLTHQLSSLDLSNNKIGGELPNTLKVQPRALIMLRSNHFRGTIPSILTRVRVLDLSNNHFQGPIPPNITSSISDYFSISCNQINGTIPLSIGEMKYLTVLDLSRNEISGTIPSSLRNCTGLRALDLSRNHLSGVIPRSLGLLTGLQSMHLSENSLTGQIPSSFQNLTHLETLDLGENNFSGNIPAWTGKSFPSLRILRLCSNKFTGKIPQQISNLTSLQVFDAARNYVSGSIPHGLENLTGMKKQMTDYVLTHGEERIGYYEENLIVSLKGMELEYSKTIWLLTCMDLSSNNLSGEIPEVLTYLLGLRALNFSGNKLTGKIPDKIGTLALLESLDFSRNQLSGTIPPSMSSLTFLSRLNLSYNNLLGKIPSGNQLQTLGDPYIYFGNDGLCGPPLTKQCVGDEMFQGPHPVEGDVEKHEEDHEMLWFYTSMGEGFVVGFCGFWCILVFKKSWRVAYFSFFDGLNCIHC